MQIHVYEIDSNPFQPRRDFDEAAIAELCESLKEHGMIQPLVVRRHGERYQLIAGERRLRAAIKAGWQQVPVQVREADDRQMCRSGDRREPAAQGSQPAGKGGRRSSSTSSATAARRKSWPAG